jgi:molybdopterin converting factor small subunit
MKIKLTAYGILRSYLGQNTISSIEKQITHNKTTREIISELGIPDGMVMLVAVNDQQKNLDYVPQDGDDIKLIPPVSGG